MGAAVLRGLRVPERTAPVVTTAASPGTAAAAPASALAEASPPASPSEVLTATVLALQATNPFAEMRRMARQFEAASRDPAALAALVPRWERSLAALRLRSRLEPACAAHGKIRERLHGAADIGTARLLELYQLARDLEELEQVAAANHVKVPALSALLTSSRHGPADGPGFPADSGVAYFDPGRSGLVDVEKRVAASHDCQAIRPDFPNPFQIYADPRDPATAPVAELGSGFHLTREPVPLPASTPARLELRAVVQNLVERSGFRVLISTHPSAPRSGWKLIALLRASGAQPRLAYHTLPAAVFAGGPWYLRLELAYDHAWYRRTPRNNEMGGYLRMLHLAWQAPGGDHATTR